jgi:hypothetical protein
MRDTQMELDMGILAVPDNTTTTMADIYGYSAFSQDFQKRMRQEKEDKVKLQEMYFANVLANEAEDEVGEAIGRVFAIQSSAIVREDFTPDTSERTSVMMLGGFGIVGALLASIVWLTVERVRKGRRVRENNNHHH